MTREHHGKDFVLGAMIGSTLGALSAILFTTKKGNKVKKELMDKYHEFHDAVKKIAHKAKVKRAVKKVKEKLGSFKSKLKTKKRKSRSSR